MFGDHGIELKTAEQIVAMRRAGLVVGQTLELLCDAIVPGMTTADLDRLAEDTIRGCGAVPSFLGYGEPPFPATVCVSVNDEIVHGIPGPRKICEGDLVSIDCGAIVDGWHGDAAVTVAVGAARDSDLELLRVTEDSLWAGIASMRVGGRVGDISAAIETTVEARGGYGIVEDYTGHGIGTALHQSPEVPNYGRAGRGPKLKEGIVLAVEPMVTAGSERTVLASDQWTVVSADGSRAAHFEHTIAVLADGLWVLTAVDSGAAQLAALGVPLTALAASS